MRKMMLAVMSSLVVLAGCNATVGEGNLDAFPEFENLDRHVDVESFETEIDKDDPEERVILLKEDGGEVQYKSIFVKDTDRHKIVQTGGENLFNDVIETEE
ncbi:hypothetical protein [Jeotgalibacillus salarius]|uniref:Uncharacterized protein n=1 Tax=Jeotgalibacillus salarius TaxID=546023 RepID=A0A4Y8LHB0_9BACL|nr:hypothetical protein [Jeotgalibacillus salarius]TFE01567.1 hypothetical protein E2626_08315 [Jeotgalibacillus salarius]